MSTRLIIRLLLARDVRRDLQLFRRFDAPGDADLPAIPDVEPRSAQRSYLQSSKPSGRPTRANHGDHLFLGGGLCYGSSTAPRMPEGFGRSIKKLRAAHAQLLDALPDVRRGRSRLYAEDRVFAHSPRAARIGGVRRESHVGPPVRNRGRDATAEIAASRSSVLRHVADEDGGVESEGCRP